MDVYARLKLFAAIAAKNLHFLTVGQMIATAADHITDQGKCWHIVASGAKKLANTLPNLTTASPTQRGWLYPQQKENQMREFLEDLIGCLCLFALLPSLWFLLYGFGWN